MKREKKYRKKEEDKQNHRLMIEYRKYQFLINDLYVYCADTGFYVIQEILNEFLQDNFSFRMNKTIMKIIFKITSKIIRKYE